MVTAGRVLSLDVFRGLTVAAMGLAYAEVSAAPENRAAAARIAPQYTPPTALRTAICSVRKSPVAISSG
jgi:hypothetical protein